MLAVVILALAAAALYAVSDFLEQRVAHRTAVELSGRDHARALSGARAVALLLLRNRIWILDYLAGGAVCLGLGLFLFARGVHDSDAQPYRTLIAVLAFDEHLPSDPGRLASFAFSAALVVVGLTVLPRSPLLSGSEPLPELEVRP